MDQFSAEMAWPLWTPCISCDNIRRHFDITTTTCITFIMHRLWQMSKLYTYKNLMTLHCNSSAIHIAILMNLPFSLTKCANFDSSSST